MKTKAILVAGGKGSRLYPFTRYTQKTLLPLYKRPVIDYALGTIRRGGIRQITIISNEHIGHIAKHVGQSMEGEQIHYVLEEEPQGVAQALLLARPHNEDCRLMIYFSDTSQPSNLRILFKNLSKPNNPPVAFYLLGKKQIHKPLVLLFLMMRGRSSMWLRSLKIHHQILQSVEFICSMKHSGTNSMMPFKKREMLSQSQISIGHILLKGRRILFP